MSAQKRLVRACDDEDVARTIATALAREYRDKLTITTSLFSGQHAVWAERQDGRRLTDELTQNLICFAVGANAVPTMQAQDPTNDGRPDSRSVPGREFCGLTAGDLFTNRPQGEAWTCPYCNTVYSGKETS